MIEGEVNDPHQEFFVQDLQPESLDDHRRLWTARYRLNPIMIPAGLISFDLAKKIMLTGKAVNFIRRCCQEQDWVLDASLHDMPLLDVN
jgi:gamma-tubulin complex component 3